MGYVQKHRRLLPLTDARGVTYRRFRDLFDAVTDDLGGVEHLSEAKKQLAKRAAQLMAMAERLEGMAARDDCPFDITVYGPVIDRLARVLSMLGIERIPREVEFTPIDRLRQYNEAKASMEISPPCHEDK